MDTKVEALVGFSARHAIRLTLLTNVVNNRTLFNRMVKRLGDKVGRKPYFSGKPALSTLKENLK